LVKRPVTASLLALALAALVLASTPVLRRRRQETFAE